MKDIVTEPEAPRHVLLVCPCCASAVDAWVATAEQNLDCEICGQHWRMVVDGDRQAEYALT